ncbi:MAG: tetratricopeptide repeat protein [Bacteroidia bacterium]
MAQYNLGVLAVKSGQLDKAVNRFQTVLSIDPKFDDARFLLAQTYLKMNQKDAAVKQLDTLSKVSADAQLIQEVNSLISQINNH